MTDKTIDLSDIAAEKAKLQAQLEQAQANVSALMGAIQMCDYFMSGTFGEDNEKILDSIKEPMPETTPKEPEKPAKRNKKRDTVQNGAKA